MTKLLKLRCPKCNSKNVGTNVLKRERICRRCGHVEKDFKKFEVKTK